MKLCWTCFLFICRHWANIVWKTFVWILGIACVFGTYNQLHQMHCLYIIAMCTWHKRKKAARSRGSNVCQCPHITKGRRLLYPYNCSRTVYQPVLGWIASVVHSFYNESLAEQNNGACSLPMYLKHLLLCWSSAAVLKRFKSLEAHSSWTFEDFWRYS